MAKTAFAYHECISWAGRFTNSGIGEGSPDNADVLREANTLLRAHSGTRTLTRDNTIAIINAADEVGKVLDAAVVAPKNGNPQQEPYLVTAIGFSMTGHGFRTYTKDPVYSSRPLPGKLIFMDNGLLITSPTYCRLFPYYRALEAHTMSSGERMHQVLKPGGSSPQVGDVVSISFAGYGFADWLSVFLRMSSKGFLKPTRRIPSGFLLTLQDFFKEVQEMARDYLSGRILKQCRFCDARNLPEDRVCASCGSAM